MPQLEDIIPLESEFKCYIRPIIDDDDKGWSFLAANMKVRDRVSIYPRIYQWRMERLNDKKERHEKYTQIMKALKDKQ